MIWLFCANKNQYCLGFILSDVYETIKDIDDWYGEK